MVQKCLGFHNSPIFQGIAATTTKGNKTSAPPSPCDCALLHTVPEAQGEAPHRETGRVTMAMQQGWRGGAVIKNTGKVQRTQV